MTKGKLFFGVFCVVILVVLGLFIEAKFVSEDKNKKPMNIETVVEQLTRANQYHKMLFLRELDKELGLGDPQNRNNQIYVAMVDKCAVIYDRLGGKFTFDEINKYLGFFEDLGFHWKEQLLSQNDAEQYFGYRLVETWEYPEVQWYVQKLRIDEPTAFSEFEALVKALEQTLEFGEFAVDSRNRFATCYEKK